MDAITAQLPQDAEGEGACRCQSYSSRLGGRGRLDWQSRGRRKQIGCFFVILAGFLRYRYCEQLKPSAEVTREPLNCTVNWESRRWGGAQDASRGRTGM
ncbi:hypothetical protein LEMLEM_LOCUS14196 [Lemmus lemmus]